MTFTAGCRPFHPHPEDKPWRSNGRPKQNFLCYFSEQCCSEKTTQWISGPLQITLSLTGNKYKSPTVCATQWLTKPEIFWKLSIFFADNDRQTTTSNRIAVEKSGRNNTDLRKYFNPSIYTVISYASTSSERGFVGFGEANFGGSAFYFKQKIFASKSCFSWWWLHLDRNRKGILLFFTEFRTIN